MTADTTRRFVQIYTGNGKGKTTAAIGQAVRAAGSGLRSCIVMFMKDYPYGELRALQHLKEWISVAQFGNDEFVMNRRPASEEDLGAARRALDHARAAMNSGEFDIVILDEVCVAVYFKLLTAEDLLPVFDEKPDGVELILTGRYCPPEWIERADLVTEMQETRHYYQQGITARKGFES